MHFGTVKTFDPVRQTGIIIPESSDRRPIRIDRTAVSRAGLGQVAEGQRLGFSIARSRRGPRAVNLWATWSGR
jgi:cold shock CspA family protein